MNRARIHGIDPQSKSIKKHYAIVYAPRKSRSRFPENCVQLVKSKEAALVADRDKQFHPAEVYGPSRSSEGIRLFYLVSWIEK